jgi:hypothetical protein
MGQEKNNSGQPVKVKKLECDITAGDINSYIDSRWKGQREYFSKKSSEAQGKYVKIQIWIMLCGAISATVLTLDLDSIVHNLGVAAIPEKFSLNKIICGILSMAVVILTGLDKLKQYREEWVKNRKNCERLKREICSYKFNTGAYAEFEGAEDKAKISAKDRLFVERVETVLGEDLDEFLNNKNNLSNIDTQVRDLIDREFKLKDKK